VKKQSHKNIKVLITGIAGFIGSHFTDFLLTKKNVKLYGIERKGAKTSNIDQTKRQLDLYEECDIRNISSFKKTLAKIKPDFIIHLAALSAPLVSSKAPVDTAETNIIGQINLLEAVRELNIDPKIVIAGSCQEYGFVKKNEIPIKESQALAPLNMYALTKMAQDLLGYQYHKSYGMKIIRTRPFHTTGPRRSKGFVCSSLARQIALIEKNKQKPVISVGNLNIKRDFTDVRDMVRAYWFIMQKGKAGEVYNISSGRAYSIRRILAILLALTEKRIKIKVDSERIRDNDVPLFVGDCSKLRKLTGWKSKIGLDETLEDLLNYWRKEV